MRRDKVRIRLKAFDHKLLDQSSERIVETARRTGARISGPVLLPTKKEIFCVNRAPNIDKESICLLYTSDAADDLLCVYLGGRRILKKKKNKIKQTDVFMKRVRECRK